MLILLRFFPARRVSPCRNRKNPRPGDRDGGARQSRRGLPRYVGAGICGATAIVLIVPILIHADLAMIFPGAAPDAPHNGKKNPRPGDRDGGVLKLISSRGNLRKSSPCSSKSEPSGHGSRVHTGRMCPCHRRRQ